jgi:hypothetical protein
MSPSGLVRQAAELGVKVVQIADNLPLDELTIAELKDLRKLSQDYGIDLQVGTRGVDRSHLLKYLEIALQLEARLIRTMESRQGLPASISEIGKNVSLVLSEFVQAGVSIALENYEAYSTSDLAHLVNTIKQSETWNLPGCGQFPGSAGEHGSDSRQSRFSYDQLASERLHHPASGSPHGFRPLRQTGRTR